MKPLGRPRSRWEDIKMVLQQVGWGGMDWNALGQDRHSWRAGGRAGACECSSEPTVSIKCGRGLSCLTEDLIASQERICSMKLFIYLFIYLLNESMYGTGVAAPRNHLFSILLNFMSPPLCPLNRTLCGPPDPVWTGWKKNTFVVSSRSQARISRSSSP